MRDSADDLQPVRVLGDQMAERSCSPRSGRHLKCDADRDDSEVISGFREPSWDARPWGTIPYHRPKPAPWAFVSYRPFCHRSSDDPRGSRVKHCNSTLAALPGEHLLLAPARHSARPALTSEFPPRPPTLTHVRLGGVDTRQLVAFTPPTKAGGILRPCATCSAAQPMLSMSIGGPFSAWPLGA